MAYDPNLDSLFENLNMISSDEITQMRTGGGTGGGSQFFEGNMDPNPLISLNPYLSENVTSFRHGGDMGASASGGTGNYYEDLSDRARGPGTPTDKMNRDLRIKYGDEWADKNEAHIEKMRNMHPMDQHQKRVLDKFARDEWRRSQGLSNFSIGPRDETVYGDAYRAEEARRKAATWREKIRTRDFPGSTGVRDIDPNWASSQDNLANLRNPYEQGYDNWYSQAKDGMKIPKYHNGGEHVLNKIYPSHQPKYAGGGSYLQQANQSIQASQQADEQQALGQLSGLVAKSLQKKISPEQATAMANQMAESSGLVNQPMANKGMRMRKKYSHGGSIESAPVSAQDYDGNIVSDAYKYAMRGDQPQPQPTMKLWNRLQDISKDMENQMSSNLPTDSNSNQSNWGRDFSWEKFISENQDKLPDNHPLKARESSGSFIEEAMVENYKKSETYKNKMGINDAAQGMKMRKRYTQGGRF